MNLSVIADIIKTYFQTKVKSMLAIVVLYIPIVFFWALYDQQGSTWVLQARRMDGRIGWFTILPDQINTFNPLFVLMLVPLFEAWLYPLANRMFKVTPLRKMAVGTILAAIAFCMAGFLQYGVELPTIHGDHDKMQFPIGNYTFVSERQAGTVHAFNYAAFGHKADSEEQSCWHLCNREGVCFSCVVVEADFVYSTEKTGEGKTRFYFLLLPNSHLNGTECYALDDEGKMVSKSRIANGAFIEIQPGFFSTSAYYKIAYGNCGGQNAEMPKCDNSIKVRALMGAAYVINLGNETHHTVNEPIQLVRPNSVNILWQVPQVFVMTVGEILLSVTGLEFSYSQAAPSMKSVLQALWLLTVFFGNMIDIFISQAQIPDPVAEFFIYAGLMFAVIGLFIFLAMRYQYVDEHNLEIPDTPERSRRSSDEFSGGSSDRRSDDDRLELGKNGGGTAASRSLPLPPPTLRVEKDKD